jgi:hypothetical protein
MAPNKDSNIGYVMNEYLISDPKERKKRALEKETDVLRWLKDEIYSTTAILADVMNVEARAARTVLNRLAARGLIVKDEIRFFEARALVLWGLTPAGLFYISTAKEIAEGSLRYHTPGSIKPLTIQHAIGVQECRFFFECEFDRGDWVSDRLLPGKGLKVTDPKRWALYPDGVFSFVPSGMSNKKTVAIEFERSRKTPARYAEIIKAHVKNMENRRYMAVWYVCPTTKDAEILSSLFSRMVREKKISLFINDNVHFGPDKVIQLFEFRSKETFWC